MDEFLAATLVDFKVKDCITKMNFYSHKNVTYVELVAIKNCKGMKNSGSNISAVNSNYPLFEWQRVTITAMEISRKKRYRYNINNSISNPKIFFINTKILYQG